MENAEGHQSTRDQQLLVEYQILQGITDHEVQTVYLTFAVFFPLLLTAGASLIGVLLSENLRNLGVFLSLGIGGTFVTFILVWAWWRIANRRQQIRRMAFDRQRVIETALGCHMQKGAMLDGLGPSRVLKNP